MTAEEFRQIDEHGRLEDPGLFSMCKPDRRASEPQLHEVELLIGATLPQKYRQFLQEYGGGEFGSEVVFSVDEDSPWYIIKQISELGKNAPSEFLPISEDGGGGVYGLRVVEGVATDNIYYWYLESSLAETEFEDIYEYLSRNAY